MNVAILSESPADETAIRILLEGILGTKTQEPPALHLRSRGWPPVIQTLPSVLKYLHYQTEVEALVVIVDSDDSPLHRSEHEEAGWENLQCRLCQLRNLVSSEKAKLRTVVGRGQIKTALGLAVPSIEAWYLCRVDTHVNEAAWHRKLQSEQITYTRRTLKKDVYGTEKPSMAIKLTHAIAAANRLASDLSLLEHLFPSGFGAFARDVRSW